ncbi:Dxo1p [Zygosaccharomyces mellis]|uniref:Decapping nuclease n=1 Tax=Zygosaccharomyces mellis TaxID=42258 RepID=A0A4C2E4I9_9SACH|nr:Dxo1p [Zygosaccharomyces mellis]
MSNSKHSTSRDQLANISFNRFQHSSASNFPSEPRNIFTEYKETSYYYGGQLHDCICSSMELNSPSVKLAYDRSRSNKRDLLGSDLYRGWENFVPLSPEILDSPRGCYQWIAKWEQDYKTSYSQRSPYVIITPRHYLVDLTMQLFQSSKYSLLCTHLGNGRIVLSQIEANKKPRQSFHNTAMSKKILHSGYVLEDLLTRGPRIENDPFFAIVEAKLDANISLVLRCELDSYNKLTDTFTELKCYAPLNMHNAYHREKLLKTWIQLAISPRCDLLVGVRNTHLGQLQDLQYFTKRQLYRKINDKNLPRSPKRFNFNADIAVQWCQHCIRSICKLVGDNIDGSPPQCFKLSIDESHKIQLEKLKHVPPHVQLPTL